MLIGLRCAHGTFVVAEGGGNGAVNANRATQGAWETFDLCNATGTSFALTATIADGTLVTFKTSGGQFLFPSWGLKVAANARNPIGAAFALRVLSGAAGPGGTATVALRSPLKQLKAGSPAPDYWWVTAEIGDPRPLLANRFMGSPQAWEKFTLQIPAVQFV